MQPRDPARPCRGEIDFKKGGGFQRSVARSKELNLYRQSYCGCEFSHRKQR